MFSGQLTTRTHFHTTPAYSQAKTKSIDAERQTGRQTDRRLLTRGGSRGPIWPCPHPFLQWTLARVTISAQMKKRTQIFSSNPVTNPYSSPIGLRQCCTNKSKVKLNKTLFFLIFVCK